MTQLSLTLRKWQLMTGAAARCIAFDLTIENTAKRYVGFLSFEFELWQVNQQNTLQADTVAYRVAALGSDIRGRLVESGAQVVPEMSRENQKSTFRLLWHYTPEQLQHIEDFRDGKEPIFEIRGNVQTMSRTVAVVLGEAPKDTRCETPLSPENGHFLQVRFSNSDWDKLLNDIEFKHPLLDRLRWPHLPPAFQQSERNLIDAWKHCRSGLPHECLSSCHKAFECLGFNLYSDEAIQRQKMLEVLMPNAQPKIREAILGLMKALQNYYQEGRHERGERAKLNQNDAEMAVVTATVFLGYLAPHYAPLKPTP
jgi:hypothetical protein